MKEEEKSQVLREAFSSGGREITGEKPGDSSHKTAITVRGDLSIQRASELRNILQTALHQGEDVVLEFAECSGTDLSFVQLLCSAHRTAVGLGKSLELGTTASSQFLRMVEDTGYLRDKCCVFSSDKTCLWLRRNRG